MHSIEVDRFFRLPKTIPGPNHRLSKHTKAQRPGPIPPSHLPIYLEKRRRRTVGSQAGRETEHLLCVHYVMQPFGFKKKETVNNITHKPAVTNILKTLLEHEFYDVKILIT